MRPSVLAAVLHRRRPATSTVPAGYTVSNVSTTTGAIAVAAGSDITLTITAATTDAAGLVFAGSGAALGAIDGAIGDVFIVSVPTDETSIHVDWAGSTAGSISFTLS